MKKYSVLLMISLPVIIFCSMSKDPVSGKYVEYYYAQMNRFEQEQQNLVKYIEAQPGLTTEGISVIKQKIADTRRSMKALDFWMRYLEPVAYMQVNGPLPVEWETEVFEKFEPPYKRNGAGLSLAEMYLDEEAPEKDSVLSLLRKPIQALETFRADSITQFFSKPDHFFFANRLFLLNLATIYTTGFECPDTSNVIPELRSMLEDTKNIYRVFIESFPADSLSNQYFSLYNDMEKFVAMQGNTPNTFDHFRFIRDYVNPLFGMNQHFIHQFRVVSKNFNDYSLNNNCYSIFDKSLYRGQNEKGIFLPVDDTAALNAIRETGRLLFFDPILSGNGKRSCAGCHKPDEYFTDTAFATAARFNSESRLPRNTPSLINAVYNHLLMQDGKHYTLQRQAADVITNPDEMGCNAKEIVENVLSCNEYRKAFQRYVKFTPSYPAISIEHIVSAVTLYYSSFSRFDAPFDEAMNNKGNIAPTAVQGFNLFMSKALCATCHFAPQFNGVKPPYVSSEFEVIGVPADTGYHRISSDSGRYAVNAATETMHAFRTGTLRNAFHTAPFMHNGVFKTIDEVISFYDAGGGVGHGLTVDNQTLPADSLHLSPVEKLQLKAFIQSLDEKIVPGNAPAGLPATKQEKYKNRVVGGAY